MVAIQDCVLVTTVEHVRQLLGKGLNGYLHVGLLGVDVENAISFASVGHDFANSLGELLKYLQIVLRDAGSEAESNLLENGLYFT